MKLPSDPDTPAFVVAWTRTLAVETGPFSSRTIPEISPLARDEYVVKGTKMCNEVDTGVPTGMTGLSSPIAAILIVVIARLTNTMAPPIIFLSSPRRFATIIYTSHNKSY
jgi:hypothetical protein